MVKVPSGKEIFNTVLGKAHVLGIAFGLFEKFGGLASTAYHFKQLLTHPTSPNEYEYGPEIAEAIGKDIGLVIVGVAGMAFDITGFNKYFEALAKYGIGKIVGESIAVVVMHSHNPNGQATGTTSGTSPVWRLTRRTGTTTSARQLHVTASTPSALPAR